MTTAPRTEQQVACEELLQRALSLAGRALPGSMTRRVAIDLAIEFNGLAAPDQTGVYAPEDVDTIEELRATAERMLRADPLNRTLQQLYRVAAKGKADVRDWPRHPAGEAYRKIQDDGRRRYFEWFGTNPRTAVSGGAA